MGFGPMTMLGLATGNPALGLLDSTSPPNSDPRFDTSGRSTSAPFKPVLMRTFLPKKLSAKKRAAIIAALKKG